MTTKFSQHQNILQPKRSLNSAQVGRVQKGGGVGPPSSRLISGHGGPTTGSTLTLNGITIGLPSSVHHIGSNSLITTTPTITSNPKKGPSTMAKRNARERNRVKQVNQGFQTLRQHIPEGYRLKKMSKVDTLRCALNYIRSMERVLDISSMSSSSDHLTGGGGVDQVTTESPYHDYSSDAMNQHLDKICSETSISLDQSFSSFSENEAEENEQEEEDEEEENPLSCHHHHHQSPYHLANQEQQQQCFKPMVSTVDNNGSFQQQAGGGGGSIILPLRLTSEVNIPPDSDENFHPTPNFVRVVEIVQLQP